jgi:hypothetical protein
MPISFSYFTPKMNLKRSYIKGVVGASDVSNLAVAGTHITFDYLFPLYHVDIVMKTEWATWSSNTYTLDWILDAAASQTYLSGSPVATSQIVAFHPMSDGSGYFLQMLASLPVLESQRAEFAAAPSSYWLYPL